MRIYIPQELEGTFHPFITSVVNNWETNTTPLNIAKYFRSLVNYSKNSGSEDASVNTPNQPKSCT